MPEWEQERVAEDTVAPRSEHSLTFKVNAQCSAISVLIKSLYLQYAYDM